MTKRLTDEEKDRRKSERERVKPLLTEEQKRANQRERQRKWREMNRQRYNDYLREYKRTWNANNTSRIREASMKRYAKDPDKFRSACRDYYMSTRDDQRHRVSMWKHKNPYSYAAKIIANATGCPKQEIPEDLVLAKNEHLKIIRKIKELAK